MPRTTRLHALTMEESRAYGRIGGLSCYAKHGKEMVRAPRQGLLAKWERDVEKADPGLRGRAPAEFKARVDALQKAHMEMMTNASREARKQKAESKARRCVQCCREQGWRDPAKGTEAPCERHAKAIKRELKRHIARHAERIADAVIALNFSAFLAEAADGDGNRAA